MQENIVVLTFAEDSKAYQALSELKQAAVQSRVQVRNAAVMARDAAEVNQPLSSSVSGSHAPI